MNVVWAPVTEFFQPLQIIWIFFIFPVFFSCEMRNPVLCFLSRKLTFLDSFSDICNLKCLDKNTILSRRYLPVCASYSISNNFEYWDKWEGKWHAYCFVSFPSFDSKGLGNKLNSMGLGCCPESICSSLLEHQFPAFLDLWRPVCVWFLHLPPPHHCNGCDSEDCVVRGEPSADICSPHIITIIQFYLIMSTFNFK